MDEAIESLLVFETNCKTGVGSCICCPLAPRTAASWSLSPGARPGVWATLPLSSPWSLFLFGFIYGTLFFRSRGLLFRFCWFRGSLSYSVPDNPTIEFIKDIQRLKNEINRIIIVPI